MAEYDLRLNISSHGQVDRGSFEGLKDSQDGDDNFTFGTIPNAPPDQPNPVECRTTKEHVKHGIKVFFGPMGHFITDIKEDINDLRGKNLDKPLPKTVTGKLKEIVTRSWSLAISGVLTAAIAPVWLSLTPGLGPYAILTTCFDIAIHKKKDE